MKLLIRNGRIVDPGQGLDTTGSVLVADGKVSWLGLGAPPATGYDVLHAEGLVVCPGFIDLHCHLRQPGSEAKETITTGTQAAAKGGFATVCCMPNTSPPLDSRSTVDYVKSVAEAEGVVRVLPIGCVSRGRKGEQLVDLDDLASAGVVGFSDDGDPVGSSQLMRKALEHGKRLGLPIIDHCEDTTLTAGGHMNEGETSTRLGIPGMPAAAEDIIVYRNLALARLTGAHLHIAHVSTAGSVELIRRARQEGINATAEVTPHHLTLPEAAVAASGTNAKVNPPLRTKRDVEALIRGLKEGVIDAIATDHAPHTGADKQCDFAHAAFGISGLETALGVLMGLVHGGQLTLSDLITRLTLAPARIIHYVNLGSLAVGASADITVFDPDREWVVDPATFASKGKNTPFAGATLRGKVMATVAQGKLVYHDDSVIIDRKMRIHG